MAGFALAEASFFGDSVPTPKPKYTTTTPIKQLTTPKMLFNPIRLTPLVVFVMIQSSLPVVTLTKASFVPRGEPCLRRKRRYVHIRKDPSGLWSKHGRLCKDLARVSGNVKSHYS